MAYWMKGPKSTRHDLPGFLKRIGMIPWPKGIQFRKCINKKGVILIPTTPYSIIINHGILSLILV